MQVKADLLSRRLRIKNKSQARLEADLASHL
jgi:hypothetical protein